MSVCVVGTKKISIEVSSYKIQKSHYRSVFNNLLHGAGGPMQKMSNQNLTSKVGRACLGPRISQGKTAL